MIPARVTDALVERFSHTTLQILLVNHINHANEVDETFRQAMAKLRRVGVTLLNQSVLLRGVNDNVISHFRLDGSSLALAKMRLFRLWCSFAGGLNT